MNFGKMRVGDCARLAVSVAVGILIANAADGKIAGILLPLIIAYVCAKIAAPQAQFLSRACHINPKLGGAIYALLICGSAVYVFTAMSHKLADQLWGIIDDLPQYAEKVTTLTENTFAKIPFINRSNTSGVTDMLLSAIGKGAEFAGEAAAGTLASAVKVFPRGIMSAFVCAVGFVYLTADMDGAVKCVSTLLPKKHAKRIQSILRDAGGALFQYLRAYATLSAVTFLILSTGLTVIGFDNPLATALIIAAVDALPMLGCGVVIIPWAAWCFLAGEPGRAIGLLVILVIVYVSRQLLEPRIIGRMSGTHPFVALSAVFIGLKLGGIGGMIVSPIILTCATQMIRAVRSQEKSSPDGSEDA